MSHMIYPNLAKVPHFDRDLNYTGIILDGWDDPVNAVPLVLLAVCLWFCGLPRGWEAWWALFNTVLIHPMDIFVGGLGRGPKYLSDEYAVMDTRYWPLDDPAVTWICIIELVIDIPLCYYWYKAVVQEKWYRHFCALLASTFQMMGAIIYLGAEFQNGFEHLPTYDWPPRFDSYLKIKYFWSIFLFCNFVWIVIPTYILWNTFHEMKRLHHKEKTS